MRIPTQQRQNHDDDHRDGCVICFSKTGMRWIALLLLLLTAFLIALIVHDVVYERQEKILVSEAEVEAQLQAAVLRSELEKQRSVPAILAMDMRRPMP